MRAYVCGPVTGYSDLNRHLFEAAAEQLSEIGMDPVIPHDFVPWDAAREVAMRICLSVLCAGGIDALAVLPGFSDSEGSCLEVAVADAIGISVYPIDAMLLDTSEPIIPLDSVSAASSTAEFMKFMGRYSDGGIARTAYEKGFESGIKQAFRMTVPAADPMNNGYMENGGILP